MGLLSHPATWHFFVETYARLGVVHHSTNATPIAEMPPTAYFQVASRCMTTRHLVGLADTVGCLFAFASTFSHPAAYGSRKSPCVSLQIWRSQSLCYCAKDGSAGNSKCICDYRELPADVRKSNDGLPQKRRDATCLGILRAVLEEYQLTIVSVALMGVSVGRDLSDESASIVGPDAVIERFPHTTPLFRLHSSGRGLTAESRFSALHQSWTI